MIVVFGVEDASVEFVACPTTLAKGMQSIRQYAKILGLRQLEMMPDQQPGTRFVSKVLKNRGNYHSNRKYSGNTLYGGFLYF